VKSGRASVASLNEVRAVFETNVFGVIAVTQAMLPLLREAPAARIVNVSSAAGSLTMNAEPTNSHRAMFGAAYSSSKTALNAITLAFALELESTGIKVNAACPGFTATDLNNFQGTRTVQQAAREPVRLALLDANGPTGTFSNEDGPLRGDLVLTNLAGDGYGVDLTDYQIINALVFGQTQEELKASLESKLRRHSFKVISMNYIRSCSKRTATCIFYNRGLGYTLFYSYHGGRKS